LAETLLESELFGHEKGAFTGAAQAKPGLLEAAEGGTLLLDEIGEMPLSTQAKLLVALERREVLRVGSVKPRSFDVRFIAATNRDLNERVAGGTFREDLLYRLNGVTIHIPPLRERTGEIEALVREFARNACESSGRPLVAIEPDALSLVQKEKFPGNIRELKSLIERAVAFATTGTLDVRTLRMALAASANREPVRVEATPGLRPEIAALERQRILEALNACGGNQSKAADLLGMPRRTLVSKLSKYGITRPRK
jgi:DNA-binding NtrC family response regulator